MTNNFQSARKKRMRWSRNALVKKARLRIERALSPLSEPPAPDCTTKIKPARFDVKINLERRDGQRIQFTCHRFGDKLMVGDRFIAPKQFGRRLGEIVNLWSMA